MAALRAFGVNDLKSIQRDSLLIYMLIIPPIMVLAVRLIVPWLTGSLSESFGLDLVPYYPMLLSFFFVLQLPLLFGLLVGLLILDERDDDTLTALRVTPISMTGYAIYRGGAAVLLSTIYVIIALPLTGLVPPTLLPALVPIAILSGITGSPLRPHTRHLRLQQSRRTRPDEGARHLPARAARRLLRRLQLATPAGRPADLLARQSILGRRRGRKFLALLPRRSRVQPGARGATATPLPGEGVLR